MHVVKAEITELSDDEPQLTAVSESPGGAVGSTSPPAKKLKLASKAQDSSRWSPANVAASIRKLAGKVCVCSRAKGLAHSCFSQFEAGELDELVDLNLRLRRMVKEDMDREVPFVQLLSNEFTRPLFWFRNTVLTNGKMPLSFSCPCGLNFKFQLLLRLLVQISNIITSKNFLLSI